MKALLLAAGEGTRLRPHTLDRPKPMVKIGGEPAVAYALRWLARESVTEVAINLHHYPEPLRTFVGDGAAFGVRVRYSLEREILGTSGSIRPLRSFFAGEGMFVVIYGDVLTNLELGPVLAAHAAAGAAATIVLTRVDDPTRAGVVAFDGSHRITRLVEKPRRDEVFSDWANAGIYVCGPPVLDYVAPVGGQDFAGDLFPAMLADGRLLLAYPTDDTVIDYGSPERLELADVAVRQGMFKGAEARPEC